MKMLWPYLHGEGWGVMPKHAGDESMRPAVRWYFNFYILSTVLLQWTRSPADVNLSNAIRVSTASLFQLGTASTSPVFKDIPTFHVLPLHFLFRESTGSPGVPGFTVTLFSTVRGPHHVLLWHMRWHSFVLPLMSQHCFHRLALIFSWQGQVPFNSRGKYQYQGENPGIN